MRRSEASDPLSGFPSERGRRARGIVALAAALGAIVAVTAGFAALRRHPPVAVAPPSVHDVDLPRGPALETPAHANAGGAGNPATDVTSVRTIDSVPAAPVRSVGAGGWVTVAAPIALDIREDGELLGYTTVPRIMLPIGRHRLDIESAAVGFRARRTIDVAAGRTVVVRVSVPDGRLNVNAVPWADVSIDGRAVGQTPLANLKVPVGRHEVVLRHPQFGERREVVFVALDEVVRLGVDLSR
jgi:hypothetical protein